MALVQGPGTELPLCTKLARKTTARAAPSFPEAFTRFLRLSEQLDLEPVSSHSMRSGLVGITVFDAA